MRGRILVVILVLWFFSGFVYGQTVSVAENIVASDLCQSSTGFPAGTEYTPVQEQLRGLTQTLFAGVLGIIGQSLVGGIDAEIMFFSFSTIPVSESKIPALAAEFQSAQDKPIEEVGFSSISDLSAIGEDAADIGTEPIDIGTEPISQLPVKYNEPEQIESMWDVPMEDSSILLIPPMIKESGLDIIVEGIVTIEDLAWLQDEMMSELGPFFLVLKSETPDVALFPGSEVFFEHIIDIALIEDDGSYSFNFTMIGCEIGNINLKLFWKWRILTEGACSVAINGVYAGCALGGQLNANCVCPVLANMPAPGSWACSIHPITFRAVWSLWGCPGVCPY